MALLQECMSTSSTHKRTLHRSQAWPVRDELASFFLTEPEKSLGGGLLSWTWWDSSELACWPGSSLGTLTCCWARLSSERRFGAIMCVARPSVDMGLEEAVEEAASLQSPAPLRGLEPQAWDGGLSDSQHSTGARRTAPAREH